MALISARLARKRTLSNVDSNQYSDDDALIDINVLIREAILMRKTNWDIGQDNLVADQNEYKVTELINSPDPNLEIISIDGVWVKYADEFKKAKPVSYYSINEDSSFSESSPVYIARDNSVFIYPTPTAGVTNGIKVDVTYTPSEVALTDNDSDIKLPSQIVDVIFDEGLDYYIESEKGNQANASNMRAMYKQELSKVNRMLGTKTREPRERTTENLTQLA